MSVFYSKKKIQVEHFLGKDGSLADSFAIEFREAEWIVVASLIVGLVAFLGFLGYLLWKCRKPKVIPNKTTDNSPVKLFEPLV